MRKKPALLRQFFESKPILRIVGAHHGLGAKLVERNGFDGVWASGLEISTAHGVPDANILTMTEHLAAASAMNEATSLPVICDCDTGFGNSANVIHMIKKYEAAGLAAVVIEDKLFPKLNSFITGRQELASVEEFAGKIEAAKSARHNSDFMIFARIEALIAGWGMEEALKRAYAYAKAGADGIVIHSKASTPEEIFTFSKKWNGAVPLAAIPTTYSQVTVRELAEHGFKMVIYANQGLRASIRAMDQVFQSIQETDSSSAIESKIAPMKEVFEIQGMFKMREDEKRFDKKEAIQAIIPAAGEHRSLAGLEELLSERPLCMLDIGGKTLLEHQSDILRSAGITDVCVVSGHQFGKVKLEGANILVNPDYKETNTVYSFMLAEGRFQNKCLMAYSDILFDRQILEHLLKSPHAITLVVDRAYQTLPFREKMLDLVIARDLAGKKNGRSLQSNHLKPIHRVGRRLDKNEATHEFIGMAFFREEGLVEIKKAWAAARKEFKAKPFYEASSVEKADFVDLIQYVVDRGVSVYGMEIEGGWSELHSLDDYDRICAHFSRSLRTEVVG